MRAIALAALLAALPACATARAEQPTPTFNLPSPRLLAPTDADLALSAITNAPAASHATAAVRKYLQLLARPGQTLPLDITREIDRALASNPYPRVQEVHLRLVARFTDARVLRKLPQDERSLDDYVALLDDQLLFARAEGDEPKVKAIEARARRVRQLEQLLDDVLDGAEAGR